MLKIDDMCGYEIKGPCCYLQVGHSDRVVTERTRWKMVATGRDKEGVTGNIFKVKMIMFCRSCIGKELVEYMIGSMFFMS